VDVTRRKLVMEKIEERKGRGEKGGGGRAATGQDRSG
jgi:hypothetical protein